MDTIGNITVGSPDVKPDASAHSPGVREGNLRKHLVREPGTRRVGPMMAAATVRRSTGINPKAHGPIDPRMPVLTPP
jgi:hypothetical protein